MITERIPDAVPLMQNTDGLETMIPREYVDKYMEICAEWEKLTSLQLEHGTYQKIILGDVNNYIAVSEYGEVHKDVYEKLKKEYPHDLFKEENGKFYYANTKCKGRFEFHNLALHKNKSFLVVPKTLFYYFVHGIEPWITLTSNSNIFDFCGGVKIKGEWKFVEHFVKDCEYKTTDLQHTLRYYMSKVGSKIIKTHKSDNRQIQIEAGPWLQTLYINHEEKGIEEYNINYDYYLDKVNKEIENFTPRVNQLSLF
jgi:hypothetical protein